MKIASKAAFLPALLLVQACQVTVDNKSKANAENAADSAGAAIEGAGKEAANLADRAGKAVEHGADKVANGVDVRVNLHGDDNNNRSDRKR